MVNYNFSKQDILINKDENDRYYITLIYKAKKDTSEHEVEVSFYVDNLTIPEEISRDNCSRYDYIASTKPKNIVFNLKYNDDGSYITSRIRKREMTKEEIEKELGYEIIIKN